MKLEIIDGKTVGVPENTAELQKIMQWAKVGNQGGVASSKEVTERRKRKHKKHLHKKVCDKCGKAYKGAHGLATHTLRMHEGRNWPKEGFKRAIVQQPSMI